MGTTQMRWGRVKTLLSTARQRAHTDALAELTDLRALLVALRTPSGWQALCRSALPPGVYVVAFVVAQYVVKALGLALTSKVEGPTPLFIHGAITVAALLLVPRRRWWLYLLLTLLAILVASWLLRLPPTAAVVWVVGAAYLIIVFIAVVTAPLVHRFVASPLRFANVSEVSRFVACVAVAAVPAALFAAAVRSFVFSWSFAVSWQIGYLGYVLGIAIFTPAIVLWLRDGLGGLELTGRQRRVEAGLLLLTTVGVGGLVFGTQLTDQLIAHALIYALVPVLIWAAVRFSPQGLASTLALATVIAIMCAVNNRGPFVGSSAQDNVLALQLFLLFIGVPLLLVAALVQERKQADTATRASEARYRAMFHSAAIGVAVTDLVGRPLEVNAYISRMMGYSQDELRMLSLRDFTHPDDVEGNEALLRRALEGDIGSYQLEKRYPHQDGHLVWGRLSASLVRDQDGQPAYFVVHLEDVTPRKQLEQEREEARVEAERRAEELVRVFEQSAEGLTVYDAAGRLVRMNAALRQLLRLDTAPSDYGTATFAERATLYQARDLDGHPLPPERAPVPRALQGEVISGSQAVDMQVRTWDGRDVVIRASAAPLRDREGRIVGAVGIYRDRTERQQLRREREEARAEAARRAEELDRIFETMADAVVVYDAQGRTVRTNVAAHQLMGLDAAPPNYYELPAHERVPLFETRDAHGRPLAADELPSRRALRGEVLTGASAVDITSRSFDGREVDLNVSAAPLRDAEGRIIGAVAIVRDQTERNRLEREREEARASELALREVNERLDAFVPMAAHDLRSPVGVSRMAIERAQQALTQAAEGVPPESESTRQGRAFARAVESVAMTQQNLNRLSRLMQLLLDASRVQQGRLVLLRQPVQLAAVVRACVEEQRLLSPSRVITLYLSDAADLPDNASADGDAHSIVVDADADRVGQVLTNYLTNAERYSPEDQPIEVRLRLVDDEDGADVSENATPHLSRTATRDSRSGGGNSEVQRQVARVEVRDHGVGIAPEDQATIWNRFQRARSVRETTGLGLGLYIARTIVELHGGQTGVESTVGHGSTFWFTLPLNSPSI